MDEYDFEEEYTFTAVRRFGDGRTETINTTTDGVNLKHVLKSFEDFLRGSGFTYVDSVSAYTDNSKEVNSHDDSAPDIDFDDDLMFQTVTFDDLIASVDKLNDDVKKSVDKNQDFLDNIFKSRDPNDKKDK